MDPISHQKERQEQLVAVSSPVEETKLGMPPALLAGLACAIPFFGSILGLVEREQPFIKHYSIQALMFWSAAFLTGWLSRILLGGEGFLGLLLHVIFIIPMLVLFLVLVALLAMLAGSAFNGAVYYLPFTKGFLVGPLAPLRQAARAANIVSARQSS